MKHTILFLMIFSVHFQALSEYDCQDLTLEHIGIGPNLTIFNFVYKDAKENQHEYIIRDFDRAASLLTILNLYLNQNENETSVIEPSFANLLQFLATKITKTYTAMIESRENEGDAFVRQILGSRIDLLSQLSEDNMLNRTLRNFNNEFLDQSSRYFQHSYRTHYHTDYNQDTQRYESSEVLSLSINATSISNVHDVIGYHLLSQCPIQGDLEYLFQHIDLDL